MAASLAGCKKALVGRAGPFLTLLAQTGPRTTPLSTIFGLVGSIQSGGVLAGQRVLTIESSLMSGCNWGHEPKEIVSKKL